MIEDLLVNAEWRKSSFSGGGGEGGAECVEVAPLADGRVAVRNSNHPEKDVLLFTASEMGAWLQGVKRNQRAASACQE
jgi:Domain of unknown function (DUF397)